MLPFLLLTLAAAAQPGQLQEAICSAGAVGDAGLCVIEDLQHEQPLGASLLQIQASDRPSMRSAPAPARTAEMNKSISLVSIDDGVMEGVDAPGDGPQLLQTVKNLADPTFRAAIKFCTDAEDTLQDAATRDPDVANDVHQNDEGQEALIEGFMAGTGGTVLKRVSRALAQTFKKGKYAYGAAAARQGLVPNTPSAACNSAITDCLQALAKAQYAKGPMSVCLYTAKWLYINLNRQLRLENRAGARRYYGWMRLMLGYLFPRPSAVVNDEPSEFAQGVLPGALFRGVLGRDLCDRYQIGTQYSEYTFGSATTNPGTAKGYAGASGTFVVIEGGLGRPIGGLSVFPGEEEVLLLPGGTFRVTWNSQEWAELGDTQKDRYRQQYGNVLRTLPRSGGGVACEIHVEHVSEYDWGF